MKKGKWKTLFIRQFLAVLLGVAVIFSVIPAYATGVNTEESESGNNENDGDTANDENSENSTDDSGGSGDADAGSDEESENSGGIGQAIKNAFVSFFEAYTEAELAELEDESDAETESDETGWTEWNEDTIDEVWAVYTTTNWVDEYQSDFIVGTDAGFAYANVENEAYRTVLEQYVNEAINGSSIKSSYFSEEDDDDSSSSYKELVVALAFELANRSNAYVSHSSMGYSWYDDDIEFTTNDDGEEVQNGYSRVDLCGINQWLSPSSETHISSVTQSIRLVYERYIECENAYAQYWGEVPNPISNDDRILAIVQAMLYGTDYLNPDGGGLDSNGLYSESLADSYWEAHKDEYSDLLMLNGTVTALETTYVKSHKKFAQDVKNNYVVVEISNTPVKKK